MPLGYFATVSPTASRFGGAARSGLGRESTVNTSGAMTWVRRWCPVGPCASRARARTLAFGSRHIDVELSEIGAHRMRAVSGEEGSGSWIRTNVTRVRAACPAARRPRNGSRDVLRPACLGGTVGPEGVEPSPGRLRGGCAVHYATDPLSRGALRPRSSVCTRKTILFESAWAHLPLPRARRALTSGGDEDSPVVWSASAPTAQNDRGRLGGEPGGLSALPARRGERG